MYLRTRYDYPEPVMVKFVCGDKEIEKELKRLHKLVTANGGLVHDKLSIGCEKGSFRIGAPKEIKDGERILVLPKQCLLPVDKFELGLKGNKIIVKSRKEGLSKAQIGMMDSMVALYNLTGKIAQHKKVVTLGLYYRERELFDLIIRSHSRQGLPFLDKMALTDERQFYLDSFIKTRVLGFREGKKTGKDAGQGKQAGKFAAEPRTSMIMPLIDFINHHPAAPGFFTSFSAGKKPVEAQDNEAPELDGVMIVKSCPVQGSDECRVNYGPYDACDTFLNYNYVETDTMFVRSVPLQVSVPGACTIKILAVSGWREFKKLPEHVEDLKFYIPRLKVEKAKNTVTLSTLLIPQQAAPRALRRVLALAVNQLGAVKTNEKLMEAVLFAEKRVIEANLLYYRELETYMKMYEAPAGLKLIAENARETAAVQLEKIRNYPFYGEAVRGGKEKPAPAGKKAKGKKKAAGR